MRPQRKGLLRHHVTGQWPKYDQPPTRRILAGPAGPAAPQGAPVGSAAPSCNGVVETHQQPCLPHLTRWPGRKGAAAASSGPHRRPAEGGRLRRATPPTLSSLLVRLRRCATPLAARAAPGRRRVLFLSVCVFWKRIGQDSARCHLLPPLLLPQALWPTSGGGGNGRAQK